ncbi:MAG: 16S rRNA (guanine(966)-N(2))-methyltransferase RsmD [Gammaproteobacteria bacterium]|nr:16S rRNA (guanine(966)-N(2))-methyltransferase RsmD [Gammaproteobacteria bacterium]
MRIVAGKWRSRLLPVANVEGLRPTSARVRETLFNWIAPVVEGARCLDLFAGTGALGFEALSRGAESVDLVENAPTAASRLRENIRLLTATGIAVHQVDGYDFLQKRYAAGPYDIVFLDPPFADGRYEELCRLLDESGLLAPGALVYVEQERRRQLPDLPAGWRVRKERTAGNVRYSLIEAVTEGSSQ